MPKVQFGDVARECRETYKGDQTGMPVVGLEHLEPETMTLHAWGSSADNSFTKYFHKGQVLFGRRRAYLKKAVVAPFDGICSGDITVIEAKVDVLNHELLPFIVQNDDFFRFAVGHSAGSLSPRVKWEHLQNYEFTLPSMAEQGKLVELLQAMERTKTAYKNLIAKTDELVKSQFVEMFGDAEHTAYEVSTVGKECTLKSGTTFSSDVEQTEGEYKYAKVSDMNLPGNEVYIKSSKAYVSTDTAGKTPIPAGAVIFPKRGGAIGTNKKRILVEDTCVDLNTMGVIPGARIITEYLYGFFNGMDLMSIADGSTIPQLNNRQIAPLALVVPPLEAQKQFAEFFNQADKSKFAAQQALADLTATQKALMRQYLG